MALVVNPPSEEGEETVIRPIMTMKFFLQKPSEEADEGDAEVVRDLVETLDSKRATCVGMAANMIGVRKRIIAVVDEDGSILAMLNPQITNCSGPYDAEEGCLSLSGTRPTRRYKRIVVSYEDVHMQGCQRTFKGRVAQAVQHEIDHCNGVLI